MRETVVDSRLYWESSNKGRGEKPGFLRQSFIAASRLGKKPVVNLADAITLVPFTVFFKTEYVHVGEEWAFLAQNGDVMPNHVVDSYRSAIDKQVETNKPRTSPNSGLK